MSLIITQNLHLMKRRAQGTTFNERKGNIDEENGVKNG